MGTRIACIATGYIPRYDGISVYTENLFDAFLERIAEEQKGYEIDLYIGKSVEGLIRKRLLSRHAKDGVSCRLIAVEDRTFFHKMASLYLLLLRHGRYEVIFATNFMPLVLLPGRIMKVIHDLSPEINPHLYSPFHRFYHAALLKSAKRFDNAIGYISRTTREDLEKFYAIDDRSCRLVYLPNGVPFKVSRFPRPPEERFEEKFATSSLSMLVVGRLNRAKGIDRILSFCRYFDDYLCREGIFDEVVLHFTGKQTPETTALFEDAAFEKIEIVFDGFLDDAQLNRLYRQAHFCIFLSRNEGYGLPLVEAMWFRAIPLLSDIPIFREIMGKSYPLFGEEAGFEEKMAAWMVRIFQDPAYRAEVEAYIEKVLAHERGGYRRAAENLIAWIDGKEQS